MKLDNATLEILKNFAAINPSLLVKQGNVVKTVSLTNSVVAKATLEQSFEHTFAVYNLSSFISALSLFESADIDFSDPRFAVITDDAKTAIIHYYFTDPSMVIQPPDKEFSTPQTNIKFRLTKEILSNALKVASVLGLPEILFYGDGKNINLQVVDHNTPSSNLYKKVLSESESEFMAYFKLENMRLIANDYDISIVAPKTKGKPGIAYLNGPGLEYWIAVEQHSKF